MKEDSYTRKNRLALYSLALILVGSLIAYFFKTKISPKLAVKNTVSSVISTPAPTKIKEKPFSVEIRKVPTLNQGFNFEATIKNISIKPFITDMAFYECDFIDKDGKNYTGHLFNCEKWFNEKAILPNESVTISFVNITAELDGGGGVSYSGKAPYGYLPKCHYDDKGVNVCEYVEGLKIKSCNAYVSDSSKQVSNGWGKDPVAVIFPLK